MARVLWMTDIYSSCGLCHIKATGRRYFEAKWIRTLQRMPVNVQHRKLPMLIAEFHPVITVFDPIPIERPSRPPTDRRFETTKCSFGHYIGSSFIDGHFYNNLSLFYVIIIGNYQEAKGKCTTSASAPTPCIDFFKAIRRYFLIFS